jgi:hypothetical protein
MKFKQYVVITLAIIGVVAGSPEQLFAASYTKYLDIDLQYHAESGHRFAEWSPVSQSVDHVQRGDEVAMRFRLAFELTATDDDIYIPLSLRKSSDEFFGGFGYNIYANSKLPFTVFDDLKTSVKTTATVIDGHAYLPAGESARFEVEVTGVPHEPTATRYNLVIERFLLVLEKSEFYKNRLYMSIVKHDSGNADLMTEGLVYEASAVVGEEIETIQITGTVIESDTNSTSGQNASMSGDKNSQVIALLRQLLQLYQLQLEQLLKQQTE